MDNLLITADSLQKDSLVLIMEKLKGLKNRLSREKNKNPDLIKFSQKINKIYKIHQEQQNPS